MRYACILTLLCLLSAASVGFAATLETRITTFDIGLHPHRILNADSRLIASALHAGLIAKDFDGSVHPRIASDWELATETSMIFELKEGITFSDGDPITSADVIASLCSSLQPASPYSWALTMIRNQKASDGEVDCVGLEAIGANTVRIEVTSPSSMPYLVEALASPPGWIFPEDAEPEAYDVVPGAGPFLVTSIEPDSVVSLSARSGGASEAQVDSLQFRYAPDNSIAATGFLTGRINLLDVGDPQLGSILGLSEGVPHTQQLETQAGPVRVEWVPVEQIRTLILNEERILADVEIGADDDTPKLTADFSNSISRDRMIGSFEAYARPLRTTIFSSEGIGHAADDGEPSIQVAGLGDLELIYQANSFNDLIVSRVVSELDDLAITPTPLELGVFTSRLIEQDYDVALVTLEAAMSSPHYWMSFFTPGSPFTVFGNPISSLERLDPFNAEDRIEAGKIIDREGRWVPLMQDVRAILLGPGVNGVRITSTGRLSLEGVSIAAPSDG